jgi:predicted lipoprotein with Yx(FWY)xxD motif
MLNKRSVVAAALGTVAVAACLLVAGVGASVARTARAPAAVAAKAPTVALRQTHLGKILVSGANGHTLYLFTQDGKNKSNCTGQCAQVWPPLLVTGKPRAGQGVSAAKLGDIKRGKGHQVTYAGHPLYLFASDTAPGQTSGEGVAGFMVVSASGKAK